MKRCTVCAVLLFLFPPLLYAIKDGGKISPFSLRDYTGVLYYSSELCGEKVRGPRVVILDFFATWCEPCKRSLKVLEKLYGRYEKKGLRVVLVSFQEKEMAIREFAETHGVKVPILMDKYGEVAQAFGVRGLPRTFLIGGDCTLRKQIIGERVNLEEILEGEIVNALQSKGKSS